jgi:hypothetical protein
MAGRVHTGEYLGGLTGLEPYSGPDIPGFSPEQNYAYYNPAPPEGWGDWTSFVKAALTARETYQPGHPETITGPSYVPGADPLETIPALVNTMGYGRLSPVLDKRDPQIREFLDSLYYAGTSHDKQSFFGDQFSTALLGLGLATGGAAAFGAFGAPAGGAASGLAPGLEGGTFAAAGPSTFSTGGGGSLFGAAAPYAGYASAGGTGLRALGQVTGNEQLGMAGTAIGYAGLLGGGMPTFGSTGDWISAAMAAAGLGNAVFQGVQGNRAQGNANEAVDLQTQIARQLFEQATPLRLANTGALTDFATTGQLPVGLRAGLDPIYATGREGLENQYNVARENLMSRIPMRGGQLNAGLANLEQQRASAVGGLRSNILAQYELPIRQNLMQMGVNAGLNQSTQGLQGIGQSANNFMQLANAASAQAGQGGQTAGALLALLLRQQQMNQNPLTGQAVQPNYAANMVPWYAAQSPLGGASYT